MRSAMSVLLGRPRKPLACGPEPREMWAENKENKTQTSLRTKWSPNVVRHHFALRAQPLQPPLHRRLRQTQRARDLLVAQARASHLSRAKSSCADKTILVVKVLANTLDLRQMWLWCIDEVTSRCCALRNCTCTVKSGQSGPRALPSRWDLSSTPRPCHALHCTFLMMSCNTELSFWTLQSDSVVPSWASNVVVLPVNVLMKICNVSCSASEVTCL